MTTNTLTTERLSGLALQQATPEELLAFVAPSSYTAAHLAREDQGIFGEEADMDVRRSIRVGEVPMPALAPDEVLVAVMASAINYNTVWSAMFKPLSTFGFLAQMAQENRWHARHNLDQHVIGSDAAGIVLRAGEDVHSWTVGDRVVIYPALLDSQDPYIQADPCLTRNPLAWGYETNFGGLAHYTVVKANQLMRKPAHLSWEEAACNTLCAMTSYRMLVGPKGAQIKQGDIVLIWGATGGVGAYAVQFVRNGGGIAVGVVNSDRKAKLLEALGCDVVLRRDELGLDALKSGEVAKAVHKALRRHVDGDPHVVFDCIGQKTFEASVQLARRGGIVVTCGSSSGYRHEFDNRHLWMRVKRIIGSHGACFHEAWECNRLIELGHVVPTLSRVFALEETGEAARFVQSNRHVGKVGVLCLAEHEGMGIEAPEQRARIGEGRLSLFRESA